eukprot:sb/3465377/
MDQGVREKGDDNQLRQRLEFITSEYVVGRTRPSASTSTTRSAVIVIDMPRARFPLAFPDIETYQRLQVSGLLTEKRTISVGNSYRLPGYGLILIDNREHSNIPPRSAFFAPEFSAAGMLSRREELGLRVYFSFLRSFCDDHQLRQRLEFITSEYVVGRTQPSSSTSTTRSAVIVIDMPRAGFPLPVPAIETYQRLQVSGLTTERRTISVGNSYRLPGYGLILIDNRVISKVISKVNWVDRRVILSVNHVLSSVSAKRMREVRGSKRESWAIRIVSLSVLPSSHFSPHASSHSPSPLLIPHTGTLKYPSVSHKKGVVCVDQGAIRLSAMVLIDMPRAVKPGTVMVMPGVPGWGTFLTRHRVLPTLPPVMAVGVSNQDDRKMILLFIPRSISLNKSFAVP